MKKNKNIFIVSIMSIFVLCGCENVQDSYAIKEITTKEEATTNIMEISEKEERLDNDIPEQEFKNRCSEIIYNDIDENSVGTYVYKDLFNWEIEEGGDYACCAIEDFLEDLKSYQKTYRIYRINDCRIDKSFPIENNDVIRVYGIVDSVSQSYFTGGYNPTIKIYYIEYIRKYGKDVEDKTMEQIKEERFLQYEQIRLENEYKDSLNADYTGTTKNVEDMDSLSLEKYIEHCDKMNYGNLTSGEDLTGRYVAIHVQLFSHKVFKSEGGKENRVGEWTNVLNVQDEVWEYEFYSERAEDYEPDFGLLFFLNKENINPKNLKKGQNIILYGRIIKYPSETYEDMEILVRYYEIE